MDVDDRSRNVGIVMTAARRGRREAVLVVALAVAASCARSPTARVQPTYTREIAPILYAHCIGCHRPGQSAPFSLLTYADAQSRAGTIAAAVTRGFMPPWLPDRQDPPFAGERRLDALRSRSSHNGPRPAHLRVLAAPSPRRRSSTWQLGPPATGRITTPGITLLPGGTMYIATSSFDSRCRRRVT